MRGTEGTSIEALRAYAREIEASVEATAPVRVGPSYQSGAVSPSARKGTTPLLPLAAVSFVLVGAVALAAAVGIESTETSGATAEAQTPNVATTTPAPQAQTTNAQRAVLLLASRGLPEAATLIEGLIASGAAEDPSVDAAITALQTVVEARSSVPMRMLASDPAVAAAIDLLEAATRPPGLDTDRTVPGHGGTPPGQDDTFTPPGQDDTFTPPGQDDAFTPPGQDDTFTPPGQDESSPGQGKGSGRSSKGTSDS